jgi:hypothetical protein
MLICMLLSDLLILCLKLRGKLILNVSCTNVDAVCYIFMLFCKFYCCICIYTDNIIKDVYAFYIYTVKLYSWNKGRYKNWQVFYTCVKVHITSEQQ